MYTFFFFCKTWVYLKKAMKKKSIFQYCFLRFLTFCSEQNKPNKLTVVGRHSIISPEECTLTIKIITSCERSFGLFFLAGGFGENISGTSSASQAVPAQHRASGGWGNASELTSLLWTWKDSGATSNPGTGPTRIYSRTESKAVSSESHCEEGWDSISWRTFSLISSIHTFIPTWCEGFCKAFN